uniref:SSD domain-containing protein n=1 Tax=Globodera pallida TaxID=36090 RepID=A0A183CA78_GLOPA
MKDGTECAGAGSKQHARRRPPGDKYFLMPQAVNYDWQAMLVCLLTSLIGFIIVLRTPQQNDIQGYAPPNARARIEYSRYQEFFSRDGPGISVYIFIIAKDGGSLLREDYLNETIKVLDIANDEVQLVDPEMGGTNGSQTFSKFCLSFCKANDPLRAFYHGLNYQNTLATKGQKLNGRINLDYPIARIFGRPMSLQQTFFGVEFFNESTASGVDPSDQRQFNLTDALLRAAQSDDETADIDDETTGDNSTKSLAELAATGQHQQYVTNMREMKMVMLRFDAEHKPGWTNDIVKQYELTMRNRFEKKYESKRLTMYVLSKSVIEDEMIRAGLSIIPYMSIGFAVMVICSVISVLIRALYMHQQSAPKVFLAIAACVLPFMSSATALGFMFLFGFRFASILCLIPILVLSIGVDSSYLMIHEWQRVIQHSRRQPNRRNCHVGYRISQVLSEIGPAVLISTLTNIFADGCGWYTSSPELGGLCLGNLVSMMVAFFYQMTFYAGLMSLVGRYEIATEKRERRELQESIRRAVETSGAGMELGMSSVKHGLTRKQSKFHEHTKHYISETIQVYVNFVANKFVAMLIVTGYFVYLGLSIWGVTRMEVKLSIQQLFTMDSPLLMVDKLRVGYQVPHFMSVTVLVFNPGNLSNPERLARMNQFVADMEAINGSWGPIGTKYFVRDFIAFQLSNEADLDTELAAIDAGELDNKNSAEDRTALATTTQTPNGPFHEEDIGTFMNWPESAEWKAYIRFDNKTSHLQRFFFTTGYHGEKLRIWTERGHILNQWRAVVDKYANPDDFNASLYYDDSIFLDLIDNMPFDTMQSVVGTLICMGIVCFLFLNSMFTVAMASGCVLSICCGILGILSWMHTDLDPITMVSHSSVLIPNFDPKLE